MNDRYQRQTLFEPLGPAGQARLRQATVAVVGCGALGTHVAEVLTRAGAGRLVLVDRDIVEWTNLHRQALFIEDDAREGRPKAIAAAAHLAAINGEVELVPHVSDLSARNIDALLDGAHVVCDGSDNVETRYLLNDWAVARGVPWVYGGAVGPTAAAAAFAPGEPCLRCVWPDPPAPGDLPTCDTAGVYPPAPAIAAAMQAALVIRLAIGDAPPPRLVQIDTWEMRAASIVPRRREDCPACVRNEFGFLEGRAASRATALCGRDAVQVLPADGAAWDLDTLAARLANVGEVKRRGIYLEARVEDFTLLVFPDARVIVRGTGDEGRARSVVARFLGA